MLVNIKPLIVVLAIGATTFALSKPFALLFSSTSDFDRRRNVWLLLTILGFLSPSFWVFVLAAAPVLWWSGRRDSNPLALYLIVLHVIPPIGVEIPTIGINELFELDMYRLLSLCVLLPAIRRHKQSQLQTASPKAVYLLLLGFGALQVMLFVRPDLPNALYLHDSLTNILRRTILFFLDTYLVFIAFYRLGSKKLLVESMAAFCTSCCVLAALAVFETARHWQLYANVGIDWGAEAQGFYLSRGGVLRATVSSGHSLALGGMLAVALGFWLFLRSYVEVGLYRLFVFALLSLGLLASYSRGPWAGAIVICFAFAAIGPRAATRLTKAIVASAVLACAVLSSPLGDRIVAVVPFLGGSVDVSTITYRERLAERSWQLIKEHPVLGDQEAYAKLTDMRQGVGVIDFVNAYAYMAVFYGIVGLVLFVGFFVTALAAALRASRGISKIDPGAARLGASLVACMLGMLLMLYTSSFIFGYEKLFYILAGLAAAYSGLVIRGVDAGSPLDAELISARQRRGFDTGPEGKLEGPPAISLWAARSSA